MAVFPPVFFDRQHFGIIAANALTDPAEIYVYARGCSRAMMEKLIGRKKADGTIEDGSFTTWISTSGNFGASNDAIDLGGSHAAEIDDNDVEDSPHAGAVRLNIAVSASA